MNNYNERFAKLIEELKNNSNIVVEEADIKKGYAAATLEEYEQDLEVKYNPALKDFYRQVGGVSISWKLSPSFSAPEEDAGYLAGVIQLLDPFTMIMSEAGTRWKDILWFEDMPDEDAKNFLPFDFPSTELIAGFKLANSKLSNELYLYESSNGVSPFALSFEDYINYAIDSRGIFYWQRYYEDKTSTEYQRIAQYLPKIFTGHTSQFFI